METDSAIPSCKANANASCPPELGLHPHSQELRENLRLSGTERLIHVQIFWKLQLPGRAQGAKEVPGSGEGQELQVLWDSREETPLQLQVNFA